MISPALPKSLTAFEPRQHLLLELRRAEAVALALLLVEERRAALRRELAHPCKQRFVRIAARGTQDVRGLRTPARSYDHDAEPVGPEALRERTAGEEPAAN